MPRRGRAASPVASRPPPRHAAPPPPPPPRPAPSQVPAHAPAHASQPMMAPAQSQGGGMMKQVRILKASKRKIVLKPDRKAAPNLNDYEWGLQ